MWYKNLLYNETKNKALADRKKAVEKYNSVIETVQTEGKRLYQTRKRTIELTESIEDFLNSITNTAQIFEPILQRINIEHKNFRQTEDYAAAEAEKESAILGCSVTAEKESAILGGSVTGVMFCAMTFARMAPDIIMWVATTFGKASTGIAISELSGAAQNNAKLAWIGDGALVKGGGGMKVGLARLALAGPIVLSITVVATSSLLLIRTYKENKKTAMQANEEANEVTIAAEQLNETCTVISRIQSKTEGLLGRVSEQFKSLEPLKDRNYAELSDDEQSQLESLVNNTLALAEMLNKVVEWSEEA